jgi:hypothetical protein
MSQYGPPGGPYPGQPQDPWQSGQPQDPYGQQQDPYAQDPWGGSPSSAPPGSPGPYGSGGYGSTSNFPTSAGNYPPTQAGNYNQGGFDNQGGGYDPYGQSQFTPPPKKRGSGLLITVVVVLAVLLCGGGAGAYSSVSHNNKDTTAGSGATDKPTNSGNTAGPSAGPSAAGSAAATNNAGDAKDAQVGDCLINDGTSDKPVLRKTTCAAGTFEILKRFDSTSDVKKCENVPGYTHNYFYKTKNDTFSFVLCMKLR